MVTLVFPDLRVGQGWLAQVSEFTGGGSSVYLARMVLEVRTGGGWRGIEGGAGERGGCLVKVSGRKGTQKGMRN